MLSYVPFALASALLLFAQAFIGRASILVPDLGPVLIVYLGLFARRERLAYAVGLLALLRSALDLAPFGGLLLLYLAPAYVVLLLRRMLFRDRIVTVWVVAFLVGVIYVLLRSLLGLLIPFGGEAGAIGMFRLSVGTLSATLLAPAIVGLLRRLRIGP